MVNGATRIHSAGLDCEMEAIFALAAARPGRYAPRPHNREPDYSQKEGRGELFN
jgi:hypothetical protein